MKSGLLFLFIFQYLYLSWIKRKSQYPKSLLQLKPKSILTNKSLNYVRVYSDNLILNDDVLVEILSRLPAKDMVRCKLVTKCWNQLISNVCIALVNSKKVGFIINSTNEGRCIGIGLKDGFRDINAMKEMNDLFANSGLPFTPSPDTLLHCSNGCFLLFKPPYIFFYVYNPITKQTVGVNHPKARQRCDSAGLVFDNSSDNSCYYIVWLECSGTDLDLYVWSSFSYCWRRYNYQSLEPNILTSSWVPRFVFIGESFYRLSFSGNLLKFGFKEKRVATIKLPEIAKSEKSTVGTCGVSQGHLHYALNANDEKLIVWMLDENDNDPVYNWVIKYTLSIKDFHFRFGRFNSFSFYDFHPTSDILFLGHKYGVFSYNPDNKKMETIFKVLRRLCGQFCILPFTQNLSALDAFKLSKEQKLARINRAKAQWCDSLSYVYPSPHLDSCSGVVYLPSGEALGVK